MLECVFFVFFLLFTIRYCGGGTDSGAKLKLCCCRNCMMISFSNATHGPP